MEQSFFNLNAMLVQGATMSDLESMISRLLDEKLANRIESTSKVEESLKDRLYKREEAARRLRISLVTLANWTKLGIINSRRIGTRIYYTDSDITNALKEISKK